MRQTAAHDSAMMLAALGILAYAASTMAHEAVGHGGFCLAAGGHNTMLTAFWETCQFPGAPVPGIKAAGPLTQFGAGLLAWLVLRLTPSNFIQLRCFLWLFMVFNLFISSAYVAFSGVAGLGDAAELIAPLRPALAWRGSLVLLGSMVYILSMRASAVELKRLAGLDAASKRLFRLVWIPYVSAGIFALCTGALTMAHGNAVGSSTASPVLNQAMGKWAALEMAVLSSFGAGSGMFGLPAMHSSFVLSKPSPTRYLKWSTAWGSAAVAVIAVFLLLIGPGLR